MVGVWPYLSKKKFGITYLTLPPLAPYLGPFIIENTKLDKQIQVLSYEKKVLSKLADNLPKAALIVSQGHPNWKNWQPLSWKGFKQTTRYTYRLNLNKPLDEIWNSLESKKRNSIKMAQREIEIRIENNSEAVFQQFESSMKRKGTKLPITKSFFRTMDKAAIEHKSRFSFSAFINDQRIASTYLVYDTFCAYLILTGRVHDGPQGTVSALIWKSIEEAKSRNLQIFDFEGSMIEGVESFFRSFGGVQTAYHRLFKTRNRVFEILFQILNKI